jgi:polyphosphate kinase 2
MTSEQPVDRTPQVTRTGKLTRSFYEDELVRLQLELVKMLEWVRATGHRIVLIFEGRDAAGKGGTISRIVTPLNPRYAKVVALPKPTEREQTEWYFQRYVQHLPAAGELVIFDRSWYNRAGVERVMGFCTDEQYWDFLRAAPEFERMLVRSGIKLIKYWLTVSAEEQYQRFQDRLKDPAKRWKFSPIDVAAQERWDDYSRAKDLMFEHTSIPEAQWWEVDSNDKRRARLNTIQHLLSQVDYEEISYPDIEVKPANPDPGYERPPMDRRNIVPSRY